MNLHLKQVKESPSWDAVEKALKESAPSPPEWKPGMSDDEFKYRSSVRTGYLLALTLLGVKDG